jgi:hypothetical protein
MMQFGLSKSIPNT